jgi:hypothetical protein
LRYRASRLLRPCRSIISKLSNRIGSAYLLDLERARWQCTEQVGLVPGLLEPCEPVHQRGNSAISARYAARIWLPNVPRSRTSCFGLRPSTTTPAKSPNSRSGVRMKCRGSTTDPTCPALPSFRRPPRKRLTCRYASVFGDSIVNGTGDDACLGWVGRICSAARRRGIDPALLGKLAGAGISLGQEGGTVSRVRSYALADCPMDSLQRMSGARSSHNRPRQPITSTHYTCVTLYSGRKIEQRLKAAVEISG